TSAAAVVWTLAHEPESITLVSVGTWTVEISWTDTNNPSGTRYGLSKSVDNFAADISTFIAYGNGLTDKTTVAYSLTPETTYWFRVWAYNGDERETGYVTSGSTKTLYETPTLEVVINEIAWMGTDGGGFSDEWIELYNNTGGAIDLSGWKMYDSGGLIDMTFAGNIPANGYYLIENDETSVNDIAGDLVDASIDLDNNSEKLIFRNSADDLIDKVECLSGWVAGDNGAADGTGSNDVTNPGVKNTMERKDTTASGSDSNNWADNDGVTKNGEDALSGAIYGTPRQQNSTILDTTAPDAITNLSALSDVQSEINLTWTAPGDDGTGGSLTGKFRIEYSSWTDTIWSSNTTTGNGYYITLDTSSVAPLSSQSHTITGLTGDTSYYFRIWTADEVANWSALSNAATCYVSGDAFGVDIQTVTIALSYYEAGGSTVILSAVPVKSTSNVTCNFAVSATTGTAGTPWQISDTPGLDKIAVYCVINSTRPAVLDFNSEDTLTNSYQTCTAAKYSMGNENGVNVEQGGIRQSWYLIKFPLASNTTAQQSITINFKAEEP
ncbi:MAG: lamin tail domain-containing protein, partial [bacterium]